jgi:hypothetical protein
MKRFNKDPSDLLDYGFEWARWMPETDSISQSSWAVTGPDATLITGLPFIDAANQTTGVYLSGGTLKGKYTLTNTMTTDQGRVKERSMLIVIINN